MSSEHLSVVFVSHASGEELAGAIRSVANHLPDAEIVVVENGPPTAGGDLGVETGAAVDELTVVPNDGFGAGCNAGARRATRSHLLFLNPDARVLAVNSSALDELISRPALGIISPLLARDGRTSPALLALDRGWRAEIPIFLGHCLLKPGWLTRLPLEQRIGRRPPWASGAAMLVRRDEFTELGGFDERLFLYHEDRDLSRRFNAARLGVSASPALVVDHARARGSTSATVDRIAYTLTGAVELAEIWEEAANAAAARVVAILSAAARLNAIPSAASPAVVRRKAQEAHAIGEAIKRLLAERPSRQYPAARAAFASLASTPPPRTGMRARGSPPTG